MRSCLVRMASARLRDAEIETVEGLAPAGTLHPLQEDPHPLGPQGAKGLGELPPLAATPAILNAVRDAAGVRITQSPATPSRLRAALQHRSSGR